MRVPSHSSNSVRRSPQQDRSAKRVSEFLQVAEALFVDPGFEAATMTAIAEKAKSSIGALYSYFPDKNAVAVALLNEYAGSIEEKWRPLLGEIVTLSGEAFSARLIDRFLDFTQDHPAFLQLVAGPVRLRRSAAAKRAFREPLIRALSRRVPALSQERAALCSTVILQIVHSMVRLYSETESKSRPMVVEEYKRVLTAYLVTELFTAPSITRSSA